MFFRYEAFKWILFCFVAFFVVEFFSYVAFMSILSILLLLIEFRTCSWIKSFWPIQFKMCVRFYYRKRFEYSIEFIQNSHLTPMVNK